MLGKIEFHRNENRMMKDVSNAAVRWSMVYKSEDRELILRKRVEDLNWRSSKDVWNGYILEEEEYQKILTRVKI